MDKATLRWTFVLGILFGTAVQAAAPAWREPIDVEFTSQLDGSAQRYVVMLPANWDEKTPADLMLALHGHGSDRWQFIRDARDECLALRAVAARYGMVFVAPDYRAKTSWMGPKAEADVLQILDELSRRYPIRRTLVCGGSMGATSALALAVRHPDRFDGVVALNGTANLVEYQGFQDAIAESYGGPPAEVPEAYSDRSAELHADRLTMPLAATVGGRDTVVPPDSVRRLVRQLQRDGKPALLIDRPDGGHATNYADSLIAAEFVIQRMRAATK